MILQHLVKLLGLYMETQILEETEDLKLQSYTHIYYCYVLQVRLSSLVQGSGVLLALSTIQSYKVN